MQIRNHCGWNRSQEGVSAVFCAAESNQDENEFKTTDFSASGPGNDRRFAVCRLEVDFRGC